MTLPRLRLRAIASAIPSGIEHPLAGSVVRRPALVLPAFGCVVDLPAFFRVFGRTMAPALLKIPEARLVRDAVTTVALLLLALEGGPPCADLGLWLLAKAVVLVV